MIKCIVCDLDGTLLKQHDEMDEATVNKIKYLQKHGVNFIMATGRDLNMVVDIMDATGIDCELVLNNGNEYTDRNRSFQYITPMDSKQFIEVATLLKKYGYTVEIFTNEGLYGLYDADTFWQMHDKILVDDYSRMGIERPHRTFTVKELFLREYHEVSTPEELIERGAKPLKIDARHLNDSSIDGIRKLLNMPDLDISSSHDFNLEITSNTSNKGLMLEKVCEIKGYQHDEVAVFGDGENDAKMLERFKYSFAPANSSHFALDVSNYHLTKTCFEGAVLEGIEILEKEGLLMPNE